MIAVLTTNTDSTAETFVRQHIRSISPGNTVVLYTQGEGNAVKDMIRLKIPVIGSGVFSILSKVYSYLFYGYPGAIIGGRAKQVERFLSENKVESVLAEFGPNGCMIAPICKKMGIRLIVNFHGHDATVMAKRPLIRRAYRFLNEFADGFVCGSSHFKKVLEDLGFESNKISVIPCGIEINSFDVVEAHRDPNLIIAIGRFVEKKAPHLSIRAFSKVLESHPNARLEMIGDGPLMEKCKDLVNKLGISEKVKFHGAQSHTFVKEKLTKASVFIQHSVTAANGDTESQGISLLEAMAAKIPVVVTRHNGFVETVLEGETGFLVQERDIVTMSKRISKILGDSSLQKIMGEKGRERVMEKYESNNTNFLLKKLLLLEK